MIEIAIRPKALQYFGEDQIAEGNRFQGKRSIEKVRRPGSAAVKVVDPHTGIDQDQLSRLMEFRSPSHFNFPRNWRMSFCWLKRTKVRKPNATTSCFVADPVAFKASSISLSSITMLVRIDVYVETLAYTFLAFKFFKEMTDGVEFVG